MLAQLCWFFPLFNFGYLVQHELQWIVWFLVGQSRRDSLGTRDRAETYLLVTMTTLPGAPPLFHVR